MNKPMTPLGLIRDAGFSVVLIKDGLQFKVTPTEGLCESRRGYLKRNRDAIIDELHAEKYKLSYLDYQKLADHMHALSEDNPDMLEELFEACGSDPYVLAGALKNADNYFAKNPREAKFGT